MTNLLTIRSIPEAPVACDMTAAEDTLDERITEYRRLFDHALEHRDSTESTTTFWFADRPGVRDWLLDLVRREAACCPFLSYDVDVIDQQIVWTVTGGVGASDMAVLDEFFADADPTRSSVLIARELVDRGGIPVIVGPNEV